MMIRNKFLSLIGLGLMLALIACGSSSSGESTSDEEGLENSASAIGALFSSGSTSQLKITFPEKLLALFVKTAQAAAEGAGERDQCDDPDGDGAADGPQEFTTPLTGAAGTYGDEVGEASVTVTEDDFCQDADGTENTGTGPDELGLFAAFTLTSEVEGTCTATDSTETTMTMTSGSGIWRNTLDSFPEAYGVFVINDTEVNCTMKLNEDQTVREGSCSNADTGVAISMDTDVTCQFSAGGEAEGEDEEDTGNGTPTGEDEEDIN